MTEKKREYTRTDSMDLSLSELQETVKGKGSLACCSPWGGKELDRTRNNKIQGW